MTGQPLVVAPRQRLVTSDRAGRMGLHCVVALVGFLVAFGPPLPAFAQDAGCAYTLGFQTLHDLAPADIGDCTDNQAFAANGDAHQHTTNGLLAWRKLDNWTAFTNGYWTWINGPNGLAKRLNTARFAWEANPEGLSVVQNNSPDGVGTTTETPGGGTALVITPPHQGSATVAPAGCVASVQASVQAPELTSGAQTLAVTVKDALGAPIAGAQGSVSVQDRTTSRTLALPATDTSGQAVVSWSLGEEQGTVAITVTETAGGCKATGTTSYHRLEPSARAGVAITALRLGG